MVMIPDELRWIAANPNLGRDPDLLGTRSELATECRKCPFVKTCDHKRMQLVAVMVEPNMVKDLPRSIISTCKDAPCTTAPALLPTIKINVGAIGTSGDTIIKKIIESMCSSMGCHFNKK